MNREERIRHLLASIKAEPGDLFLNYALALEYSAEKENHEKSYSQFNIVLDINKAYVPAFYQLGKLCENTGKTDEALDWYRKGLEKAREQGNNKAVNEFNEAIFLLED